MAWCEDNDVHFLFGLAKNERLVAMIADEPAQAEAKSRRTGKPARYLKAPSFPAATIVCFSGHALLCPFCFMQIWSAVSGHGDG
jgi:hypothetical protein